MRGNRPRRKAEVVSAPVSLLKPLFVTIQVIQAGCCFWRGLCIFVSLSQLLCLLDSIKQWSAAIPISLVQPTYFSVLPFLPFLTDLVSTSAKDKAEMDVYFEKTVQPVEYY